METRAAYIQRLGAPLVIEDGIRVPDPRPGQVLVKLAYSGVCHSQIMEVRGRRGDDPWVPHMLGHEGSGRVIEVGSGVTKVRPGDRVTLGWIKGEGCDAPGARYAKGELRINAGGVTTFMEYAVVSENRLVKLPDDVPMDVAVLFGCALPTGAGIVLNTLDPEPGSSIAIWGLGGIGMSALMATRAFSLTKIIAVDVAAHKLELARELGATHCIDASEASATKRVLELTAGEGVDYAVEAAGTARTIEQAFETTRRNGGLCAFATHPAHGERISIDPFDLISGKRIVGSWGGGSSPDRDVPRFAEFYRNGAWPLESFLSRRYSLDEINDALDDLEARRLAMRALIEIDPSIT